MSDGRPGPVGRRLGLRAGVLPWAAVVAQLLRPRLGAVVLVVGLAAALIWVTLNLRRMSRPMLVGALVMLLGATFNVAAIVSNGRMPYAPAATARAGIAPSATSQISEPHVAGTRLPWLTDRYPVPPLHLVASIGDGVLVAGLVTVLTSLLSARPSHRREEE
jgi:hypothetical protein